MLVAVTLVYVILTRVKSPGVDFNQAREGSAELDFSIRANPSESWCPVIIRSTGRRLLLNCVAIFGSPFAQYVNINNFAVMKTCYLIVFAGL